MGAYHSRKSLRPFRVGANVLSFEKLPRGDAKERPRSFADPERDANPNLLCVWSIGIGSKFYLNSAVVRFQILVWPTIVDSVRPPVIDQEPFLQGPKQKWLPSELIF